VSIGEETERMREAGEGESAPDEERRRDAGQPPEPAHVPGREPSAAGGSPLASVEEMLGHRFRRPELLEAALTHRSRSGESPGSEDYERLEFLGDAVLGTVAAHWLYDRFPGHPEGELSRLKSYLVSEPVLAGFAESLGLGEALRLGVGEERSGGREKDRLLADAFEAVLAALYLEGGIEAVSRVALPMLEEAASHAGESAARDPKTELQERLQAVGVSPPEYKVAAESGPDHQKLFVVECWSEGRLLGSGEGSSKKRAEKAAAESALCALEVR
jgi:ribonuclease III